MTSSHFRPCGNSLTGHNLTAFNLIYLPLWKYYFYTCWQFLTNVYLWIFLLGIISQTDRCKHVPCQYRWKWESLKSQNGACSADTEVCGRGHQQIKRSQTLKASPSLWHTPQVTRVTMQGFFGFYPPQTAKTMSPPWAICCAYSHPQVPCLLPWERRVDRKGRLGWDLQG